MKQSAILVPFLCFVITYVIQGRVIDPVPDGVRVAHSQPPISAVNTLKTELLSNYNRFTTPTSSKDNVDVSVETYIQPPFSAVNALKTGLLGNYNRFTTPTSSKDNVDVSVETYIKEIGDLDEELEKLTTIIQFYTTWFDESISWNLKANASSGEGILSLELDAGEVWTPLLRVSNRHYRARLAVEDDVMFPVEYDFFGRATMTQTIIAETSCDLDLRNYPFDTQTCRIQFFVNKKHVSVQTHWREFILSAFEPDGSWHVANVSISSKGNIIDIDMRFTRLPGFILINFVVPMTILALLSPLAFLLPNQSGERVGFSITNLLAISVYMTLISDHLPQKSNPMPLAILMLFLSYMLTSLVIVVVIINARVYRLPNNVAIPRVLIKLHFAMTHMCCCFRRRNRVTVDDVMHEGEMTLSDGESTGERHANRVAEERHEKRGGARALVTWKDVSWAVDMFVMTFIFLAKLSLIVVFLIVLNVDNL